MEKCLKCGTEIVQPTGPGRPRAYCSTGCRRAAEKEIGLLNDRLAILETQASNIRIGHGMYMVGTAEKIEVEILRIESRLRLLLEAAPE